MRNLEMGSATRDAYGKAIAELGEENPNVVVLDADLAGSTRSGKFAGPFPNRFWNVGIAEANLVGIAAGMAASGKIPFISSFAVFLTAKGFDQLRMSVAYPGVNVKVVCSHGGISIGEDGPSQMAIEDIALMAALPGFHVLIPSDEVSCFHLVKAIARHDGPVYMRTGRPKFPKLYSDSDTFTLGGSHVHQSGKDVTIVACGVMVGEALKAADVLAEEGIEAGVIDAYSIKPLDNETILGEVRQSGAVVTAEEHLLDGGLGSRVARMLAENHPVPMRCVGVNDTYAESASPDELLVRYGLTWKEVAEAARNVVQTKAVSK
jgi:transketolase